jgi:ectoine utilization protein EutC
MGVLLVKESEIRGLIELPEAIQAMEDAFAAYSAKAATVPPVMALEVPEHQGEVHIKAGRLHKFDEYVLKVAAGFWENRSKDLPIGSGMMLVFSAITGFPQAILLDNGYLTELRTAAAGGLAAKFMAPQQIEQVAVIGAGSQGRWQLDALSCVRQFRKVLVYDHHPKNSSRYVDEMQSRIPAHIHAVNSVEEAVRGSQVVITATPSREPVVMSSWIDPGTHITAMGSDGPDKQELEARLLERADRIVADSLVQCLKLGEIHHAVEAGLLTAEEIEGELGQIMNGEISGRDDDEEITICDLTGVGVQDAAIARLAFHKARALNRGFEV